MKKLIFIILLLSSCGTSDKTGSVSKSFFKNSTNYIAKIKFFKKDSIKHYNTIIINPNSILLVNINYERGKGGASSYIKFISDNDSVLFEFNSDTFLTHFNYHIDSLNKNGYSFSNPNNILNPYSFKKIKITETKKSTENEYLYEITNQDFLNARK